MVKKLEGDDDTRPPSRHNRTTDYKMPFPRCPLVNACSCQVSSLPLETPWDGTDAGVRGSTSSHKFFEELDHSLRTYSADDHVCVVMWTSVSAVIQPGVP